MELRKSIPARVVELKNVLEMGAPGITTPLLVRRSVEGGGSVNVLVTERLLVVMSLATSVWTLPYTAFIKHVSRVFDLIRPAHWLMVSEKLRLRTARSLGGRPDTESPGVVMDVFIYNTFSFFFRVE